MKRPLKLTEDEAIFGGLRGVNVLVTAGRPEYQSAVPEYEEEVLKYLDRCAVPVKDLGYPDKPNGAPTLHVQFFPIEKGGSASILFWVALIEEGRLNRQPRRDLTVASWSFLALEEPAPGEPSGSPLQRGIELFASLYWKHNQ